MKTATRTVLSTAFVLTAGLLAAYAAVPAGPSAAGDAETDADPVVQPLDPEREPIDPLPSVARLFWDLELDLVPERVELGRQLFHDSRLSRDFTLSCASCHDLRYFGIDRSATAMGIGGQVLPLNTPTVYNAALNVTQFWDGRARDLEEQAGGPPTAAAEMGGDWDLILGRLREDAELVAKFKAAFPGAIEAPEDIGDQHMRSALADFQRTLITVDSPFDRYLSGDPDAVSLDAKKGYQLFKDIGCADCHYGSTAGGRGYERLGRKRDYFARFGVNHEADLGRYNVTQDDRDRHVFKVPNLRNVSRTGPYFHDGSQATLEEAVRTMGRFQLDMELNARQVELLAAFLRTLEGRVSLDWDLDAVVQELEEEDF